MPKNLFQDMVKVKRERHQEEGKQSFKEKISKVERAHVKEKQQEVENLFKEPVVRRQTEIRREIFEPIEQKDRRGSRKSLWVVAGVAVLFFLFALSFLFTSATITINPKVTTVSLNENWSAVKDATTDTDLPFSLAVISGEEDQDIQAGTLKDTLTPATGTVVVYNAFSTASQNFDINTRLEASNGKIYKTSTAITVPGMKGTTPGSVEVNIYATEGGDSYNSGPLDFKILGFKGTPKYDGFYARSKGDISGGFQGQAPVLTDADKTNLHNNLKLALENKLSQQITAQIPSGFVLFPDAVSLSIDGESFATPLADNTIPATMKGTMYGILFDQQKLAAKIANAKINNFDGSDVYVSNLKDLTFTLISPTDFATSGQVTNINFTLSGSANVTYRVDESKFISDLLGKSKSDFNQVLAGYPNIDSAQATLSPFWKMSFPGQEDKIKVIVNYPK